MLLSLLRRLTDQDVDAERVEATIWFIRATGSIIEAPGRFAGPLWWNAPVLRHRRIAACGTMPGKMQIAGF